MENFMNEKVNSDEVDCRSVLEELKCGKITINDLMGPLTGIKGLTSTSKGRFFHESNTNKMNRKPTDDDGEVGVEKQLEFLPLDEYNQKLVSNVHPIDYRNPNPCDSYDLVVIGAGVTGLLSVITAKWLGKKCALIESHAMGGDCLNIGCVPSKAFIASAKVLQEIKTASKFGIHVPLHEITIDFAAIMTRMRKIRADISPHDSVERYSKEFCEHVFIGSGSFSSEFPNTVEVTGDDGSKRYLPYKKAMIATGASASIPEIIHNTPHLTNKNFFNLVELPPRIVFIGCGPISLELAQGLSIYGSQVTCIETRNEILHREDHDAAELLHKILEQDGITFLTNTSVVSVEIEKTSNQSLYCSPWPLYHVKVINTVTGNEQILCCDALFNGTGRVPNVRNLGLDQVSVSFDLRNGVHINEYFETSNANIYACGDCATPYKFTHAADFQARLAIRNMFLSDRNRLSDLLIPWCTYTHPEVAHVGKYEHELQANNIPFEAFVRPLAPVDRCRCDGIENGFVKLLIDINTQAILGCTIVAPSAGDMISEITVCMQYGIGVAQLAGVIHPYPTTQESIRQCALQYYKYLKDPNGIQIKTLQLHMRELEQREGEKTTI